MNTLHYRDNLTVLRNDIRDECVDLIYLDPPFNSQANYNVLFKDPTGQRSEAQIEAFGDTWHWGEESEQAFDEVIRGRNTDTAELLRALRAFLRENDVMAYSCMMAVRMLELHRVLKPTGSLYLHCDPTASHYIKILMDSVFGKQNFRNEIIWKRTSSHNSAKRWGPVHDVILFYTKSDSYLWNRIGQPYDESYVAEFYRYEDSRGKFQLGDLTGAGTRAGESGLPWRGVNPTDAGRHWAVPAIPTHSAEAIQSLTVQQRLDALDELGLISWPKKGEIPRFRRYFDPQRGAPAQDIVTDIAPLSPHAKERLGYPTQKPLALLERIVRASSNEGDLVLDPFCGCGTTIHAAHKLNRQWIGIDITHLAISLIEKRLNDAFPGIHYTVHGTPKDLEGARDLAARDKHEFQLWAGARVNAVPFRGGKKGADSGIDGLIYFKPDSKSTEKAIVSVKGGDNVNVAMIRDLAHVVDRENAKVGVFITLAEPTGPMKTEAIKAGMYETQFGKFPKLQILTIADLFDGRQPKLPWADPGAFKKAGREIEGGSPGDLPF